MELCEIIENEKNFEKVVDTAINSGWYECRVDELKNYLDTIIDSCRLSFGGTLEIDGAVLTTILKIYSKTSVKNKMEELKAEEAAKLQYVFETTSGESEEQKC